MNTIQKYLVRTALILVGIAITTLPYTANAHCDTEDGPVVNDARKAIEQNDVTPVLKWIAVEDEEEIRTVFAMTMSVRTQSDEAKEVADRYFYETVVRVHRASENAPYTGLKPAGAVEPHIAAADAAIESGSVDRLATHVAEEAQRSVREKFDMLMEARKHKDASVEQGRAYVRAYVEYVHHVEALAQVLHGEHSH